LIAVFAIIYWYALVILIRNSEGLIGKCPGMEQSKAMPEYTIMIRYHLGMVGEVMALVCAFFYGVVINIVNFILIVQYLFGTGISIYQLMNDENATDGVTLKESSILHFEDAACVAKELSKRPISETFAETVNFSHISNVTAGDHKWTFNAGWDVNLTIPIYCLVVYGLLNFRNNAIFNRLGAVGNLTNIFIVAVLIYKAIMWSSLPQIDFSDEWSQNFVHQFSLSGGIILTGYLQGAFFVHDCVITVVNKHEKPQNRIRDATIAFALIVGTYIFLGLFFYLIYPGWKLCIADVFINNFSRREIITPILYFIMFLRGVLVYPINVAGIRNQIMASIFGKIFPSYLHVCLYNLGMMMLAVIFAIFYDRVGDIFRFGFAFCSFAFVYLFPFLIELSRIQKDKGAIPVWSWILHIFLILIGLAAFVTQFITDAY